MNSRYLLEVLVDPRFSGAACAGDHDLFDPRAEGEDLTDYRDRAALARTICSVCPILARCAEVLDGLTVRDRAGFTYAGQTFTSAGTPAATKEN